MTTSDLSIENTPIDGLLLVQLPLQGDNRGWFKEHWQREKMVALGLPDFRPVQQNLSYNSAAGTTRGLHAEPWDKYVSVASGRAFGAWVDLREGPSFGTVHTAELRPDTAVFVPRGVANAFQTLEPDTTYMYLVNDHWSPRARYTLVNLADASLGIDWPIPLDRASISDKDRNHPNLVDATPIPPLKTVVLGSSGQLGRAMRQILGEHNTTYLTRDEVDLLAGGSVVDRDWSGVGVIINAAAYTDVDLAETPQGRRDAWQINATAVRDLARVCIDHNITLVHISTDYVFDGEREEHPEDEPFSPLNAYGQSKAAGELAASLVPKHYILRTSWVIGDGNNFIATMTRLARTGIDPSVIDDQYGRLTFSEDLAAAVNYLVTGRAPHGIYNVTSGGEPQSWYDVAQNVFEAAGADAGRVGRTTATEYAALRQSDGPVASRPRNSLLPTDKLRDTGFQPATQEEQIAPYVRRIARQLDGGGAP